MSLETIKNKLAGLPVSEHGKKWLTQALYPPGDLGRIAIPTESHYPTLRMEYRPTSVIGRPAVVASGNWDLILISLPWDSTALIWAAGPPGTDFANPGSVNYGYLACQPNLANTTVPYNVLQRTTAGAQTANNSFSLVRNAVQHNGYRLVAKSYTAHMTASDLYNSGSVTSCQYDSKWTPAAGYLPNGTRLFVPCLGTIPLSEDAITQSSPFSVVSEAKHGVFVPHRLLGDLDFVTPLPAIGRCHGADGVNQSAVLGDSSTASQIISVVPALYSSNGTSVGVPGWFLSVLATAARPDDLGLGGMTSCVSIFRGINYEATITVTAHVSYEYILAASSPFRTMTTEPDEPDPTAIKAYFEVAARMPHAYPASYNALGLVLPALATALRAALPHIPKLLSVAGPIVGSLLAGAPAKAEPRVWARPVRGLISAGPAARRVNAAPPARLRAGKAGKKAAVTKKARKK